MNIVEVSLAPGYRVSDEGDVWGPRRKLKPQNKDGYRRVCLSGCRGGAPRWYRVHRLVAEAFIPNPLNLSEVNHKDGDKTNNRASNLEWTTRLGNVRHAYTAGLATNPSGEKARRAILTQEQVDYIRQVHVPRHPEFGQTALGRRFGVTNSCIWRVIAGDNWG